MQGPRVDRQRGALLGLAIGDALDRLVRAPVLALPSQALHHFAMERAFPDRECDATSVA